MKKVQFILFLTFLGYSFSVSTINECTEFEGYIRNLCEAYPASGSNKCYYTDEGLCKESGDCSSGDATTCNSLIPSDFHTYKCKYSDSCQHVLKECSDYKEGDICESLAAGTNKRCKLSKQGECEVHYDTCEDFISGVDETKCKKNIPSDSSKKCIWEGEACKTTNKECDDYDGTNGVDGTIPCQSLATSNTKKTCIFNGKECKEEFASCESYEGDDEPTCKKIKPYETTTKQYKPLYHCVMGTSCTEKPKKCEDYIEGEDDDYCTSFQTTDSTNKKCIFDKKNKQCYEEYNTCEGYNTNTANKKKEKCELIYPDYTHKCVFEGSNCVEKEKTCSDYVTGQPENYCTLITTIEDYSTKKLCKYIDGQCIENYISCTSYTGADKKICESIILDTQYVKCALEKDTQCIQRTILCSEATNEDECENAQALDPTEKSCKFTNNKCIEDYITCETYKGHEKDICESIIPPNDYQKCEIQGNGCKTTNRLCSEARNKEECEYMAITGSSDSNRKRCQFINNKCIDQYIYCSEYLGDSKEICESIKPYTNGPTPVRDTSGVCVFGELGCEKKQLKCSEARNANECSLITPKDTKKYCYYNGEQCTEQYRQCSYYTENVEKNICETIIPQNYLFEKCVYTSADPEDEDSVATCGKETKKCAEFNTNYYQSVCSSATPLDITKKCIYSNKDCSETSKTCLEITFSSPSSLNEQEKEETCKAANTSNNNIKKCSLMANKSGCQETDKQIEPTTTQPVAPGPVEETTSSPRASANPSPSVSETDSNDNSSGKQILAKFIFLIISLLF